MRKPSVQEQRSRGAGEQGWKCERGFTLAGALCLLAVMAILLAISLPLWSKVKQRDNEEELIFRGQEYVKAISRYQAKFHVPPPDLDTLYKLKFIRHLYPDPMTRSGKWKLIHQGEALVTGQAGKIGGGKTPTAGEVDLGGDDENDQTQEEDQTQASGDEEGENSDEEKEVETIGPVIGVVSRSKKESMRVYNGADHYNKWYFIFGLQQQQQPRQQPQGPNQTPPPGGRPTPTGNPRPGGGTDRSNDGD